ncbi:MAG: hypothetical protein ACPGYY_09685 [Bacteroidia bacterium]
MNGQGFRIILVLAITISLGFGDRTGAANQKTDLFELQIAKSPRIEVIKEVASNFELKYPSIETETTYFAPNFVLSTLDCESKNNVEKLKGTIENDFPNSELVKCTTEKN